MSHVHPEQFGKRPVELSGGDRPLRVQAEATEEWLAETIAKARTIREAYDQADTVEKMHAMVAFDTQRRAELRREYLARQGNGAALDDDEGE